MDDFGSLGTHWVCCWPKGKGLYEYFDSFGLPPPLQWEKEMSMHGMTHFFINDNQIQWEQSVRCGYYCLLFLNERNKGTSFADILKMFSNDLLQNEKIVKIIFLKIYNRNVLCERRAEHTQCEGDRKSCNHKEQSKTLESKMR